jgi:hypothetical protein
MSFASQFKPMDAILSTQLANNGLQILKRGKKLCSTNHGKKKP